LIDLRKCGAALEYEKFAEIKCKCIEKYSRTTLYDIKGYEEGSKT